MGIDNDVYGTARRVRDVIKHSLLGFWFLLLVIQVVSAALGRRGAPFFWNGVFVITSVVIIICLLKEWHEFVLAAFIPTSVISGLLYAVSLFLGFPLNWQYGGIGQDVVTGTLLVTSGHCLILYIDGLLKKHT